MTLLLALAFLVPPPAAGTITSPVGTGEPGFSGDGGPAASARLNQPFDVLYDSDGHLYVSDTANHRVRRVDATTGTITTVVGNGKKEFAGDGGPATDASLDEPYGLAFDAVGNLYIADRLNRRIRRVDGKTGLITTLAGTGKAEFSGDGGPAVEAGIVEPNDVAFDPRANRLLIADVAGHRVRSVDLATGRISTFAGTGQPRHDGDRGAPAAAALHGPRAVSVVPGDGSILILERNGNTLRIVRANAGFKTIDTLAGSGRKGFTGDGGPMTAATFDGPKEMALDPKGNLYIVDTENHAIRRIDVQTGRITTVAGTGSRGGAGDDGPAISAQLDRPHGVAVAPDGAILIGDTNNHRLRRVAP